MKRTRLSIRRDLLEEAKALSGEPTYARTVDRALGDLVRRLRARQLLRLRGSGLWEGKLIAMREDRPLCGAKYRRR